ncbi:MAG: sugar kinase [Roseitalea porphyridii]|uniref:sugar kinase n=1 Tax=Roseitalea porphyridii TaxID=1852022 RepID=UPI0032D9834B
MRVVSIGECMIELSGRDGPTWRQGFAGDTLNTLWYLRALLPADAVTDYVSAFGDDPFSAEQIAFLKQNCIGTAHSPVIEGKAPGLYAITLDAKGERSFTYWRGDAAARRLADDPAALAASIDGADLVYFSGITLAIIDEPGRGHLFDALAQAAEAGATIAFDPNYRPRLWPSPETARAAIERGCMASAVVLPTFDDEQALFGDAMPEDTVGRIGIGGARTVIVKRGGDDAFVWQDGTVRSVAPPEPAAPVDTTGAGDSFNGAFLAAHLSGVGAVEATLFAHRVAARVIGRHGALLPADALADLRPGGGTTAFS